MEEKNLPLVSVVVPCYNHEKYVKETIESIINQTYKNIELIVIDDGSKDNSVSVIQELADKYGFTFIHRANKGLSATLNEGIRLSKGKYFCACASDDIFILNKIEIQINHFENYMNEDEKNKLAGIFGYVEVFNDKNTLSKKYTLKEEKYNFNDIFFHKFYLPAPTAMYRRDIIIKVNGFDEGTILEDWSMYLKLSYEDYSLVRLPYIFTKYRRHQSNISNDIIKLDIARKKLIENYKSVSGYNFVRQRLDFITAVHFFKKFDLRCIKFMLIYLSSKLSEKLL